MRKAVCAVLFLVFCPFLVAQQALNNDSIIKMVKAGLTDDVIVATINASLGRLRHFARWPDRAQARPASATR
jgi:hypothetical protein